MKFQILTPAKVETEVVELQDMSGEFVDEVLSSSVSEGSDRSQLSSLSVSPLQCI